MKIDQQPSQETTDREDDTLLESTLPSTPEQIEENFVEASEEIKLGQSVPELSEAEVIEESFSNSLRSIELDAQILMSVLSNPENKELMADMEAIGASPAIQMIAAISPTDLEGTPLTSHAERMKFAAHLMQVQEVPAPAEHRYRPEEYLSKELSSLVAEEASVVDLYLASRHQLSLEEAAQVRSSIEYPYQSIEQVPLHPTAEEATVASFWKKSAQYLDSVGETQGIAYTPGRIVEVPGQDLHYRIVSTEGESIVITPSCGGVSITVPSSFIEAHNPPTAPEQLRTAVRSGAARLRNAGLLK